MVLNRDKPPERARKLFLLNASLEFRKGDPKNFLPPEAIDRISSTFVGWTESKNYSRIVSYEEIADNDFNISPSRYIDVGTKTEHRPIGEIIDDLQAAEAVAARAAAQLDEVLVSMGYTL